MAGIMEKVYCYGSLGTYKENIRGLLKNSHIRFKNFKIKRWSQQASHSEPFCSIGSNQPISFKKWKTQKRYILGSIICTYLLSWEGGICAGRTDLVQRGAWVLPESQIFSGPARTNSVDKHSFHMTVVFFNFSDSSIRTLFKQVRTRFSGPSTWRVRPSYRTFFHTVFQRNCDEAVRVIW